ncbi:hypothetical protein E6O75_ATG05765 [Venturia nashicola]|uniref:Uncharacterized protein n=1 Tax=Venturia nashicola TaxID=86259 RepID=A0A4Z1PE84_9PEZI|nr:hypothetical protein E6O75_ATG05765 [Venturia nashicola]
MTKIFGRLGSQRMHLTALWIKWTKMTSIYTHSRAGPAFIDASDDLHTQGGGKIYEIQPSPVLDPNPEGQETSSATARRKVTYSSQPSGAVGPIFPATLKPDESRYHGRNPRGDQTDCNLHQSPSYQNTFVREQGSSHSDSCTFAIADYITQTIGIFAAPSASKPLVIIGLRFAPDWIAATTGKNRVKKRRANNQIIITTESPASKAPPLIPCGWDEEARSFLSRAGNTR